LLVACIDIGIYVACTYICRLLRYLYIYMSPPLPCIDIGIYLACIHIAVYLDIFTYICRLPYQPRGRWRWRRRNSLDLLDVWGAGIRVALYRVALYRWRRRLEKTPEAPPGHLVPTSRPPTYMYVYIYEYIYISTYKRIYIYLYIYIYMRIQYPLDVSSGLKSTNTVSTPQGPSNESGMFWVMIVSGERSPACGNTIRWDFYPRV